MVMVSELNRQKNELTTLLKNKDREIADLKAQGVSVSRSELHQLLFMYRFSQSLWVISTPAGFLGVILCIEACLEYVTKVGTSQKYCLS